MKALPALPLESIAVASPCQASWDAMVGDDRRRFCGQCNRHVFNLSGMTREEAEALVGGGEGPCVRYFVRADGTVLTADCPVGVRAARRRLAAVGAALTSLLGVVGGALGWRATSECDDGRDRGWFAPEPPRRVLMGRMILRPPPRPMPAQPPAQPPTAPTATDSPG